MSKFILEIELKDDICCEGCPCKNTDFERGCHCNALDSYDDVDSDVKLKHCPLKTKKDYLDENKNGV